MIDHSAVWGIPMIDCSDLWWLPWFVSGVSLVSFGLGILFGRLSRG
jgi:hypothetical protein